MAATVAEVTRPRFADAVRALGRVALIGLICGAAIGGVGGRLAMMVLRFTSNDAVVGLQSDDGFTIGRFSAQTLFLIAVTGFLGLAGALLYSAGRGWVPRRWRPAVWGALCGLLIGADLVNTEGIDFRLLAPRGLAIAMFVAIPALYGLVVSVAIERSLSADREPGRAAWLGYLPLIAFALLGPPGVVLLVLLLLGCLAWVSVPVLDRLWRWAPVTWLGRIALVLVAVASLLELIDDTWALLS
jgi:hypothetical protein